MDKTKSEQQPISIPDAEQIKKMQEWLQSEEGQKEMKESVKKVEEVFKELDPKSISWDDLNTPYTC